MKTIKMSKYGTVLTGREYGKNAAEEIFTDQLPRRFDFSGVASMGSSFGDEIFKMGSLKGISSFISIGANKIVQACLKQIQEDLKIEIQFENY